MPAAFLKQVQNIFFHFEHIFLQMFASFQWSFLFNQGYGITANTNMYWVSLSSLHLQAGSEISDFSDWM